MYMKKKWIAAATIAALLPFSPLKPAAEQIDYEKIKGNLVIAGGALGSSNKAVYEKFIELAGGNENAKIGIIPAASGSLKSSTAFKKDMIAFGINPDSVEILPLSNHDFSGTEEDESKWAANSNKDKVANQIKDLTAVWFVGGDQVKIVDTLREGNKDSKALKAIWDMYEEGGVIGGTSAGAAIMSDVMITGGDSLGALKGQSAKRDKEEYQPLTVEKGLGFFKHGIIDQHMNERARYGRLTVAAVKHEKNPKQNLAYGVDEDTAMVVSNEDGTVEVIGRSGLFVADVSQVTSKEDKQNGYEVKNAKISYLSPGDKVNIDSKTIDVSSTKSLTNRAEYYTFKPLPATGVFTPYGRLQAYLSYSLVDNQQTDSLTSQLLDSKGKGKVTVVDIDNAKASKHTPRAYEDISLSALSPGDTINVKTNEITVSDTKIETIGAEYSNAKTAPHTGVFSPHGLVNNLISYDLIDNEANKSVKSYSLNGSSGFELTFAKIKKTAGYWGYADGQRDSYSYKNVSLSIKPITVKQK